MSEYSARQFADCPADNIRVSDRCADRAGAGEFWFVEDGRELIGARGAEELVLYRWNRSYPGDVTLDVYKRQVKHWLSTARWRNSSSQWAGPVVMLKAAGTMIA